MALGTYALGDVSGFNPAPLLAIAAGFFIYIAASDLIPDIHEKSRSEGNMQAVMLLIGVVLIGWIITATAHSHEHGDEVSPGTHDEQIHVE